MKFWVQNVADGSVHGRWHTMKAAREDADFLADGNPGICFAVTSHREGAHLFAISNRQILYTRNAGAGLDATRQAVAS